MNGAMGSGVWSPKSQVVFPIAIADRYSPGQACSTLVNVSSYCREKPTTSKSVKGVADSRLRREDCVPEGFLMSSQGALLALALPGHSGACEIFVPMAHSMSYKSKREATRKSTSDSGLRHWLYSPPRSARVSERCEQTGNRDVLSVKPPPPREARKGQAAVNKNHQVRK